MTQRKLDKSAAGVFSLQVGAGSKKPKQLSAALRGHFEAQGVPLKREVAEFRVSEDALLPVGTVLGARRLRREAKTKDGKGVHHRQGVAKAR